MKGKTITTDRKLSRSMTRDIVIGLIGALSITVALTAILTSLILNGSVEEGSVRSFVFAIRLLSVLIGCLLSTGLFKGSYLSIAGIIAAGYMIIMVAVGIVFYDGSFHNFVSGALSTLIGAVLACLVRLKATSKRGRKPYRVK